MTKYASSSQTVSLSAPKWLDRTKIIIISVLLLLVIAISTLCIVFISKEDKVATLETELGSEHKEVKELMADFMQKEATKHGLSYEPSNIMSSKVDESLPLNFNDGTELTQNRAILGELFESDMVLTVKQMKEMLENGEKRRKKRKIQKNENYRWGLTIPYRFDKDTMNEESKTAIIDALNHWQEKTCLKFVEDGDGDDSILFIRGSGCYSYVGRTGGQQLISIGPGCESLGIAAHEIGHAMGFWHEQARPDRDRYIRINQHNIIDGLYGQFTKRVPDDINDYGMPYDMGSVMHYGSKAFSRSWSVRSIETVDPNYQNTIGQRKELSFIDVKIVNEAYCADKCSKYYNDLCKNGGYANPKNCRACICPKGLGGTRCDRVETSKSYCGGEIRATNSWQTIRSPKYSAGQECVWKLQASGNQRIILDVRMISYPCGANCDSFLEVKHWRDLQQTGARFCCDRPKTLLASDRPEMYLIHHVGKYGGSTFEGFEATFKIEGTTPRVTTTRRPPNRPVTAAPKPWGEWGQWGHWSSCSSTCGGCGRRARSRQCGGVCTGMKTQEQACGLSPCPVKPPTGGATDWCKGSLKMPCSKIETIFGAEQQDPENIVNELPPSQVLADDPLDDYSARHKRSAQEVELFREKRETICTKTFFYQCRKNDKRFVQIVISEDDDSNLSSDAVDTSAGRCCPGYELRGQSCLYKQRSDPNNLAVGLVPRIEILVACIFVFLVLAKSLNL